MPSKDEVSSRVTSPERSRFMARMERRRRLFAKLARRRLLRLQAAQEAVHSVSATLPCLLKAVDQATSRPSQWGTTPFASGFSHVFSLTEESSWALANHKHFYSR